MRFRRSTRGRGRRGSRPVRRSSRRRVSSRWRSGVGRIRIGYRM